MARPSHQIRTEELKAVGDLLSRVPKVSLDTPLGLPISSARLEGEASRELRLLTSSFRSQETNRWADLCKEYPAAISFVDLREFPWTKPEVFQRWESFAKASSAWLDQTFASRENDFWEEWASPGVYWVRFKTASDFEEYQKKFKAELTEFEAELFSPPMGIPDKSPA